MPKLAWVIAAVLTGVVLLTLLGLSSCVKSKELDQAKAELAQVQSELARNQAAAGELGRKILQAQTQLEELQKEKVAVVQSHRSLEDEMRAALESKDVTISQLQGKLTVNILDRVMFDSGEADLKPDGEAVLRKVAGILGQHSQLRVHVIGHTDNVPIKTSARSRFPSNWELSTARATAAVRFLTEKAGVDPHRLGAVGYGEFRPVADNSTPEGRARNRRIAITILSEELVGADTAVSKTSSPALPFVPNAGSNAPPVPETEAQPSEQQ